MSEAKPSGHGRPERSGDEREARGRTGRRPQECGQDARTGIHVRAESPDAAAGRELFDRYQELVRERLGREFVPSEDIFATPAAFSGPGAAWLVLYERGEPVACGGLRPCEPGVGEIKRMFVAAAARRRGHGRRLLAELEAIAREAGQRRIRLLTTEALREARELYARAGYHVVAVQERNGRRDLWLEKEL